MVPMTLLSADLRYPCWDVPSRCCSDHLVLTPGGIDAGYFDNLLMDLCARSYFYEFQLE